ncbi:SDR family oxidoreductase [Fluviibacterium sp. DFM31]|uniref:SDR family oxidoreductase n=1 Tax=Meridianimarinicoccus marinus TaxID=3231483 RepID=A0ABV3LB02_9RHOB
MSDLYDSHPELRPVAVEAARYPSLKGRGVLITGGGSGIGAGLVEAFCDQGARVGFIDLSAAGAEATAGAVAQATGTRPEFAVADLRDIAALQAAVDDLRGRIGPVTVLVNNAGNDDRLPAQEVTPDYWDERFHTNIRHQFFAAQAVCADMKAQGGGAIVNMGSNSWMQGAPGLIAYTTAKSAVQGMTKSLAREWGVHGIRVNSIVPGWILTERQVVRAKAIYQDKFDDYLTRQCLKEFLLPPDVARMALWLAADDSRLVTSQSFIVDGGVV